MKKIYMILAAITLLSMSLNAQTKVETPPDGYFRMGPSRVSTTPVTPPYSNSFDSSTDFDWWETINNNGDSYTWDLYSNAARIHWNGSQAADDWLVTAPITLKAGKTYKFYIDTWAEMGSSYPERLEVKLASANTNAALSAGTTIIGQTTVTASSSSPQNLSNTNVTVSADGDYYIGIHGISDADMYYLYVDNFVIDVDITDPTITASPTSVSMNAAPGGTTTETVTVTGLNLTDGITYTLTDANSVFSVSPASLGTTGGTLTITYSPTAAGNHSATLVLNSTGADPVTITINGSCVAGTVYELVTDPSTQLVDGKEYILVGKNNQYAMGAISNNYGSVVAITDNGNGTVTVPGTANPLVFTLHSYSSNYTSGYALEANGNYLRPSSSSSSNLTTATTSNDYTCWSPVADVKSTGGYGIQYSYLSTNRAVAFRESSSVSARFAYYAKSNLTAASTEYYYALLYVEASNTPTISASPNSVSMSAASGESANQTVTVTGMNLTDGITATISGTDASLFSVSPASLSTSGGQLTITYSPTAVGTHTATLTLSSTGADPVNITLNGTCSNEVTVCDGTNTDMYLPVYGGYYDEVQMNQMIYPASMLSNLQGKDITSITFYPATVTYNGSTYSGIRFKGGKVMLSLGSTTNNSFSSNAAISATVTEVASITDVQQDFNQTAWTFTFDTPYRYEGGNLLVQVDTEVGTYNRTYFYGSALSNMGRHQCSGDGGNGLHDFLPKATFTFEESTPPTPELTAPTNGSTVNVGTNEGSGVSTTINVSGNNLTENLTVSVSGTGFSVSPSSISAADANAGTTVTVTYTGTDPNATGTLTISSGEVSVTVDLTASYVQVVPTIAMTPASQTINDAAAGALTVTGTNVTGNINVSAGSDWSLSPTSLSSTGGQVNVSYTGRALSATTTVTASANGATDATATVNYVADLYIVTDNGVTGNWDFTNGTHMTYNANDGSYTATFTANNDNTFILFARMLGNGVDWNTRYVFGPDSNGDWWLNGDSGSGTIDTNDDDPIKIVNGGTYTVTIYSDGTFTITASSAPVQVPVLITPVNGSTVFVGTTSDEEPSVSKEIPISGNYLTKNLTATVSGEGFSLMTRDVTVPYADVNAATASVTVVYSGTNENATGTLTLSSDEVSATVNLTASYRKPVVLTEEPAGYVVQDRKTPNEISTAVIETAVDLFHGEVLSVTYVNTLGMTSDKPFEGVNIVVTRYSDGTTITSKEMR